MPLPPFLAAVDKYDPDFAKAIENVYPSAMGPGALDQKTRLLIALALDASHGASQGVISITMSLISLLFIAVTTLLSKRYSAKWRYYAWLIIIIGMIIPFRPQFDMVLFRIPSAVTGYTPSANAAASNAAEVILENPTASTNIFRIEWHQIIGCLWPAGVFGFMVYHALRHRYFMIMVDRWSENVESLQILNALQQLQADMKIAHKIRMALLICVASAMQSMNW